MSALGAPAKSVRRIAASAWVFRHRVELEAQARFARLAERLAQVGAAATLVERAREASSDERRHARLCAGWAAEYGERLPEPVAVALPEIAPSSLKLRGKVLYEIVAACCITETESMSVLTTLLRSVRSGRMRQALHELAQDEVGHSRLGWAHLAGEHEQGVTGFLGPLIPAMLQGSVDADLFQPAPVEREDEHLLEHGVLPHSLKRELFTSTLQEVVLPGLERFGIDSAPARAWLERRREAFAPRAAVH